MDQLRPYQRKAIGLIRERIADRPVCCLPTGAGKTHIAAEIIRRVVERGGRALMVAHRRELILQARDRLAVFGIEAGVVMPGFPESDHAAQVGSIQTLVRRKHVPADLLVIDEAHHAVSQSYLTLIECYPSARLVGLTATPARLDGRGLGRVFGCIVEPVTVDALVGAGYLVEPTVYAPPTADLTGIRKAHGDYGDMLELGERMAKLTGDVVTHYKRHCAGWPTVAFACNVEHSKHVAEQLCAAGFRFRHLDATSHKNDRAAALRQLQSGAIHGVVNCDLFGEGVDVPALRCAIVVRPTLSLTIHRQQIGRIMRPPGPCIVLDHAGNVTRHGLVTDHVAWSLDDRVKRKGEAPVKTCPSCYRTLPTRTLECPDCGYEFDPSPPIPDVAAGTLAAIVRVQAEDPREVYADLVRTASTYGHAIGWARHRYFARFGKWPRWFNIEKELYVCTEHEWETSDLGYLWLQCRKCRLRVERGLAGTP